MTHELLSLELSKKRAAQETQRGEAVAVAGNTDLLHASFAERRAQLQVEFPYTAPLSEWLQCTAHTAHAMESVPFKGSHALRFL